MYLLDTNIYINFYDRYYPINHFATFWEKFIPILQNQIMIPDVVVRENMHNPWFKSDLLANNYQKDFIDHRNYQEEWVAVLNYIANSDVYSDKVSSVDTSSFDINFENPNLDELGSRDYPSNYNDFIDLITISESEQKNIKNKLSNDLNEENEQFKKEPKYNLLEKWLNQFEEKNITQIIVLGHSLGKVDKGYFELINQKYHSTTWCISYYNKQDQVFENAQSLSFYNKLNFKQFNTLLK
ncbi:DUF4411 family protein [Lactobacillus gasseri]|uniref:DUF4411 family protein n=1 Tax=Lactobacillus gasseri TaxID=1596 RepID=A0AB33ZWC2_LACGS|nr:DUF4411 family protein [Lactobacillus gasseri]GBA98000.1 hypothetical protein LJCM1025_17590 [Lactobacillus gasseri]